MAATDLHTIVSKICDEADEFLGGTQKRDEGRSGISEWLTVNYPKLTPADRKAAVEQAMRILENEGFFEGVAGGRTGDNEDLDGFERE